MGEPRQDMHAVVRAALSARLDGENAPSDVDDDMIDTHLSACADCREWFAAASDLNRRLRMSVAPVTGGSGGAGGAGGARALAESMARVADETPQLSHRLRNRSLPLVLSRIALVAVAVCYVVWSLLLLTGAAGGGAEAVDGGPGGAVGNAGDPDVASLSVDAAAVRLALAAGLLWGAARPRSAPGLFPVFLALWGFGAGFATRDIVLGFLDGGMDLTLIAGLLLHLAACAALVSVWLSRNHAVTPLRQSLRGLSARPVRYSPDDVEEHSSWRPGDDR
ncbi:zf-HC2 domain-containing protein [Corynebacterium sp.]|uniref:zf-HC2 domain-containing protein n=1 Tax=Corynebacterium sp. TaxID=1720 RepID=UPI003B3A5B62